MPEKAGLGEPAAKAIIESGQLDWEARGRRAGREFALSDAITVFLCDDVADIRMLMRFGLEEEGDVRVVGEAEDGVSGVQGVTDTQPDVLLLDLSMPRLDGLEVISRVRRSSPRTGIVVFSGFARERMGALALEQGADRYLQKGVPLETVRAAVREVARERADRHDAA